MIDEIELLESKLWRLMNAFGWSPWHDGAVQEQINQIDKRLAELRADQAANSDEAFMS